MWNQSQRPSDSLHPVHEFDTNDSRLVFLLVQASGVRSNVPRSAFREDVQAADFIPWQAGDSLQAHVIDDGLA